MTKYSVRGGVAAVVAAWACLADAAVVGSRSQPGARVSFKETSICETTPGVKGYSGFVTLPASERQPYETSVFFWFFEARRSPETAPLAVWLQGGPGAASTDQAASGHNGPCIVNADSRTTAPNPHSWTEVANMLYVDQPAQTGFSYDSAAEGVYDLETGAVDLKATTPASPLFVAGRFPSQDPARTANSTQTAAHTVYRFLQAWFDEFAQYRRDRISVWSQSYGGHYVPAIASIINREFKSPGSVVGSSSGGANTTRHHHHHHHRFGVDSAGIINGMVDLYTQLPSLNEFAFRNTYGIPVYNESVYRAYDDLLRRDGGCLDSARACRDVLARLDPDGVVPPSMLASANFQAACGAAVELCGNQLLYAFTPAHGRHYFDIAQQHPLTFPRSHALGWLNRPEVQAALGVKTNYLASSNVVGEVFAQAADVIRSGFVEELAALVDDGVKVALIYGDRDYRCNWFGGEAVSLAVKHNQSGGFAAAGYADITVGGSTAGKVRQHGLFSFSRIYNAGHEVPSYKPAESLELFRRTILGKDLATGGVDAGSSTGYHTTGPAQVFDVQVPLEPAPAGVECYTWTGPLSIYCTPEQIRALANGTAVVKDFIVVEPAA
ncbi:hypothetical protein RB595_001530 [Gaeumannomyces hyphopodioides]